MTTRHFPQHVGIIPDGNRRWARSHDVASGYRMGVARAVHIIQRCRDLGIQDVTAWASSLLNVESRSASEVMEIHQATESLISVLGLQGIHVDVFGSPAELPVECPGREAFRGRIDMQDVPTGLRVHLGIAYHHRYARGVDIVPPMQLLIRTGGKPHLGGFLPLHTSEAELYFTDVLWPDFDAEEFAKALAWYGDQPAHCT